MAGSPLACSASCWRIRGRRLLTPGSCDRWGRGGHRSCVGSDRNILPCLAKGDSIGGRGSRRHPHGKTLHLEIWSSRPNRRKDAVFLDLSKRGEQARRLVGRR